MTPEREEQVLKSLYDRLFDAITYSPDGKTAPWHKDTTYIQMAKNLVLDPNDFSNMLSPSKPNGDMKAAAAFSAMVDAQPATDPGWVDSGKKVSAIYKNIVDGADSDSKINPEQQNTYNEAYNFLNTETTVKDFKGNEKTRTDPSDIAIAFDEAQAAYITAVGGYRTAYNGYDLDRIEDQRAWNAVAPGLQLNIDQTWNKWTRAGKAEVVDAQNALASTINDAIRNVIAESQKLVNDQHHLAPLTATGSPWLPSFALPTSWADPSSQASKLTFKSSYLNESASSSATSYSASASGGWGLWHASGGVSGSHEESKAHMDAENLTLEADLINVTIKRPWFNPLLFSMNQWWMSGINENGISNGAVDGPQNRLMPLVPTGFVVARNVKITADFSEQDKKFVADSISTKVSGGWGPFSVSGSFSHSSSKSEFQAKFDGGTLELPGLQLIAWISSIMPASPPENPK